MSSTDRTRRPNPKGDALGKRARSAETIGTPDRSPDGRYPHRRPPGRSRGRYAVRRSIHRAAVTCVTALLICTLLTPSGIATAKPKKLARGLMTQGVVARLWPAIVDVWNPIIEWRDIEPEPGVFRFGPIYDLIKRARENGDLLRLRIFAGRSAPDWTLRRFGSVTIYDPIDGVSAAVPRWWVPGYMDAYARLQRRLAAAFDDNPTIRAVTISGAMTIYAEPFIRQIQDSRTRANLLAAGYTKRKDKRAHLRALEAHTAWVRTRQILTVNPWQYVDQDGSFGFRVWFTNHVMNACRKTFGNRCILQNNSMRSSWLTDHMPGGYEEMFAHMEQLGPPLSFQTANISRVGDLALVLDWFVQMGAHGAEMKPDADELLSTDEAATYDRELESNG